MRGNKGDLLDLQLTSFMADFICFSYEMPYLSFYLSHRIVLASKKAFMKRQGYKFLYS